jgi:hypothetical protein
MLSALLFLTWLVVHILKPLCGFPRVQYCPHPLKLLAIELRLLSNHKDRLNSGLEKSLDTILMSDIFEISVTSILKLALFWALAARGKQYMTSQAISSAQQKQRKGV